jgi:hypothetical protein
MFKKKDSKTKYDEISKEIEDQLEIIYTTRKEEIEKELEEKIRFIREEAERKITKDKEEIDLEKKELRDYTEFIDKLETEGKEHIEKINHHLHRVGQQREEIRRLAEQMRRELAPTIELNQKLDMLQKEAEEKAGSLKSQLKDKYGIEAEIPESSVFKEKVKIDLSKEAEKLGKIEELLGPTEFTPPEEKTAEVEQPA